MTTQETRGARADDSPSRTTTTATAVDFAQWWNDILKTRTTDVPIGCLVDGLDRIGHHPIPYTRLPTRADTAFGDQYTCWRDLTPRTLEDLGVRARVATVRALIEAAHDAVAMSRAAATERSLSASEIVHRAIARLDRNDRAILARRHWTQQPETAKDVATYLNTNPAWVLRHEKRAVARFTGLLKDPVHRQLAGIARKLRRRLGPYVPVDTVEAELRDLDIDPEDLPAKVLLYAAGPYRQQPDTRWFEDTAVTGRTQAAEAIDAVFDETPTAPTAVLISALRQLGMPAATAHKYLYENPGLRHSSDVWVRWNHTTTADKIEALLLLRGKSAAAAELHGLLAEGSIATVEDALIEDDRFLRATRTTWALRDWGTTTYQGIVPAITSVIADAGGSMPAHDLIREVRHRFPDIAESSIRSNVSRALTFITDNGMVRLRTAADDWPTVPPFHTVRGAFRPNRNELRLAILVNTEILRGSTRPFPTPVAVELGCTPGQKLMFDSEFGSLAVGWSTTSTPQTSISSLRAAAIATSATHGDTLVLAFHLDTTTVTFSRIPAGITGLPRLKTLLGRSVRNPTTALATSLHVRPEAIADTLYNRGDTDLAELARSQPLC